MTDKELLSLLQKATGLELNEEKMKGIIDQRLVDMLKAAEPKKIHLGDDPPVPEAGFSRFLGDVRRLGMGQASGRTDELVRVAAPGLKRSISPSRAKDLREGATTAGGYLVPTEQAGEVLNLVNKYSAVKELCRQVPMSAHQITFPTVSGGLTAYWVPEASDSESAAVDGTDQVRRGKAPHRAHFRSVGGDVPCAGREGGGLQSASGRLRPRRGSGIEKPVRRDHRPGL